MKYAEAGLPQAAFKRLAAVFVSTRQTCKIEVKEASPCIFLHPCSAAVLAGQSTESQQQPVKFLRSVFFLTLVCDL